MQQSRLGLALASNSLQLSFPQTKLCEQSVSLSQSPSPCEQGEEEEQQPQLFCAGAQPGAGDDVVVVDALYITQQSMFGSALASNWRQLLVPQTKFLVH